MPYRIESLMSARLFLAAQHDQGRIYFLSNISGHLSLYAMNYGGSVPEPLLPPNIALQNPDLIGGYSFYVFPKLGKILVMIDRDGDENYQPMLIPMEGGFPEPAFDNALSGYRVHLADYDKKKNIVYLLAERRDAPIQETYRGNLKSGSLTKLAEGTWAKFPASYNADHNQVLLGEGYMEGDLALFLLKKGELKVVYGKPIEQREENESVPLNGIGSVLFSYTGKGTIVTSAIFDDAYSLGYITFAKPGEMLPVKLKGIVHHGLGEMERIGKVKDDLYLVQFNIDGCSWLYEGIFDEDKRQMNLKHVLVGHSRYRMASSNILIMMKMPTFTR